MTTWWWYYYMLMIFPAKNSKKGERIKYYTNIKYMINIKNKKKETAINFEMRTVMIQFI
jgi:hypothetical protein